jgi:hypothetical protein
MTINRSRRNTENSVPSLLTFFRDLDLVKKALTLLDGPVELGFPRKRILFDFLSSFPRKGVVCRR